MQVAVQEGSREYTKIMGLLTTNVDNSDKSKEYLVDNGDLINLKSQKNVAQGFELTNQEVYLSGKEAFINGLGDRVAHEGELYKVSFQDGREIKGSQIIKVKGIIRDRLYALNENILYWYK